MVMSLQGDRHVYNDPRSSISGIDHAAIVFAALGRKSGSSCGSC